MCSKHMMCVSDRVPFVKRPPMRPSRTTGSSTFKEAAHAQVFQRVRKQVGTVSNNMGETLSNECTQVLRFWFYIRSTPVRNHLTNIQLRYHSTVDEREVCHAKVIRCWQSQKMTEKTYQSILQFLPYPTYPRSHWCYKTRRYLNHLTLILSHCFFLVILVAL